MPHTIDSDFKITSGFQQGAVDVLPASDLIATLTSAKVNPLDGRIWAVDGSSNNVATLTDTGGKYAYTSETGDLNAFVIRDVAVNFTTGDVWIADLVSSVFKRIGGVGTWLSEVPPTVSGSFPTAIAVDSVNNVVYMGTSSAAGVFSRDTTVPFGTGSASDWDTEGSPIGDAIVAIAINPGNLDLWITNDTENNVQKRTAGTGAYVIQTSFPGADPFGVTVDPNSGDVYVTDQTSNTVYRLPGGDGTAWVVFNTYPAQGEKAGHISFNTTNNTVWVSDVVVGEMITTAVLGDAAPGSPGNGVNPGGISGAANSRTYAQYRTEVNAVLWLNIVETMGNHFLTDAFNDIRTSYDIDTQEGEQLDIIGRVVVQSRNITVINPQDEIEFNDTDEEFGDSDTAEFMALTFESSVTLDDELYKLFLKSKIQRNNKDATIDDIIAGINTVLSTAVVTQLNDNEDMTFDIEITGVLSADEVSVLNSLDFIPTPQAVRFTGFTVTTNSNPAVWVEVEGYSIASSDFPRDITVDPANGRVYVSSNDDNVYKIENGAEPWEFFATVIGATTTGLMVDHNNSDVWLCDFINQIRVAKGGIPPFEVAGNFQFTNTDPVGVSYDNAGNIYAASSVALGDSFVYKLTGGVPGAFIQDSQVTAASDDIKGVAVNPVTGDIWTTNSVTGDVSLQTGGTGPHVVTGNYSSVASQPFGIAINFATNDVYVIDQSTNEIYLSAAGTGPFAQFGVKVWGNATAIAVNSTTNDIWVAEQSGSRIFVSRGV